MLKLDHISKQFPAFHLADLTLELPGGYILGLIGENGAGKTTLLRLLAGLYTPDEGSIWLNGLEYGETQEAAIKQQIGVVFQEDLFDASDSLLGNAAHYGRFYQRYDEALFLDYLEHFALEHLKKKRYDQLSKGEKLKFALAFALAHQPTLLLLDEPTANLDRDFRRLFFPLLRQYVGEKGEAGEVEKRTVILATHLTSNLDHLADYLLYLKQGQTLLFGDIEQIRGSYRMAAGEEYLFRKMGNQVIHLEQGEFGTKALLTYNRAGKPLDSSLTVWEPSVEELMYFLAKRT